MSNLDHTGSVTSAGSCPSIVTPNQQQKRLASTLQTDQRSVRTKHNTDQVPTDDQAQSEQPTLPDADDNNARSAIHNAHFPMFKLLRKLNNKLVTAQHHKKFLSELKENGQVEH